MLLDEACCGTSMDKRVINDGDGKLAVGRAGTLMTAGGQWRLWLRHCGAV
ncbi:unnamed protein product [Chondrus crispus]|uniref:Uncharacterized protein n=1 Tax=Chondrus crispus TaxID=2769 RepID=R7QP60_CHOCR|nr:unnamed protein product [Chondrus crispus]CDF39548.1 unnamed protein product [Chondrus crispus]|eukprot:XP_005709842.1 unnamed protein product [Chondrus crispus]